MSITQNLLKRYSSILVLIISFVTISILSEQIATRLYLNIIITILLFAVIPSSFCYMYSCKTQDV